MHDEPIRRPARTPLEADTEIQGVVLTHLLLAAPNQLTIDELLRELTDVPDDFDERDLLVRAVRDLTRSGLLHRHGDFLFPSRAASRFSELPAA